MKVDLEQLQTFICVAKLGSIIKASEQLFISQSTVNSRIRVIEEELECQILQRSGRGVELTPKGELFYGYVNRTMELVNEGIEEMKSLKQFSSSFQLAAVTEVATYFLPHMIQEYRTARTEDVILIQTASTPEILDRVMNGVVELGLVRGPFQHKGVESTILVSDPIIPIMSNTHPWVKAERIEPEAFLSQTILTSSRKSSMWQSIVNWFKTYDVTPRVGMEVDHIETTKRMIYHEFGISFVPSMSVKQELDEGKLKEIPLHPRLELYRDTVLIRHKSKPLSKEAGHFWDFLIHHQQF